MTSSSLSRDDLTRVFLKQWNKSIDDANVKLYARKWWMSNRRDNNSLRLSADGMEFLTNVLNLVSYQVSLGAVNITPQILIRLNQVLDCPYYLTDHTIVVFSQNLSVEMLLFDDIEKFSMAKSKTSN